MGNASNSTIGAFFVLIHENNIQINIFSKNYILFYRVRFNATLVPFGHLFWGKTGQSPWFQATGQGIRPVWTAILPAEPNLGEIEPQKAVICGGERK